MTYENRPSDVIFYKNKTAKAIKLWIYWWALRITQKQVCIVYIIIYISKVWD